MSERPRKNDLSAAGFAAAAFGRYAAPLHRFLAHRLRDPDSADDVSQEVFSRLLRMQDEELVRKPRSYLFGIAFHVVREFLARRGDDRIVFDSDAVEHSAEHPAHLDPAELEEQVNLRQQLDRALGQLPEAHRTVLLLCKRDGMTYEEAAQVSGLSVHTVEKYLVQARAKLMALAWDR